MKTSDVGLEKINILIYLCVLILQNNTNNSQIYFNITTLEGQNLTVKLNSQGFAIVSLGSHDDVIEIEDSADSTEEKEQINQPNYFETPYSLLDSISPAYR